MAKKKPLTLMVEPAEMNRLDIEQELEQLKGNNEILALRRKLALFRRLKTLPALPKASERDPECAYPL